MKKTIRRRSVQNIPVLSGNPLLDRLYAARGIQNATQLELSLTALLSPVSLKNLEQAVALLINAFKQQQQIVISGDFDADGATSTALAVLGLRSFGFQKVDYLVPNRFEQGYGLSVSVAQEAIEKGVELLITVDNGISSFEGIAFLKKQGVSVLVTDHHLPAEQLPEADAIVNPNLSDCTFPSKSLAGVGVTFYLLAALRAGMQKAGLFIQQPPPNLATLLDLVALGTVADVVPLDQNNRILVSQGLQRIKNGFCRCGIKALVEVSQRNLANLTATDLGFAIAPRLNAAGRLDNMSIGVELLLAESMEQARALALDLDQLNQTRKEIEQGMKAEAIRICQNLAAISPLLDDKQQQTTQLPVGLTLYQADWHQGVLGILAARIKDKYHRPVIAFAQENQENSSELLLKGSARSINGVHMRDLLERIDTLYPNLILKFGGHAMAAGLSIRASDFERFSTVFNQVTAQFLDQDSLTGVIESDGELSAFELNLNTAELLQQAGPWGQHFPEPVFDGEFRILQQRLVGGKHLKMLLEPMNGGDLLDAIWFNIDLGLYPDNSIKSAKIAYKLEINEFRGNRQIQLLVSYLEPLD
ncbi:single-stranded-DNA-specific exonuclease RecJ [Mergibacter septicus]|uniref:Single-stranded-DNA-specific exonuclease RecJ n=1 Tax=Mergibacter septicus TaxID=221402 RepID=A0A8E3MFD3_9PAST|nr:single-stranded-DNA-specific exonuclease RecJ [Mergibacter septicus]AWX14962.1 single-stranded-DNA-specific exonuclease RecJ [Mergibacter septicus]QDJ14214.1 single-stranded-DNA-specific exonuclease RecJ [Mergibacter septicus]UTU48340.1 single-stranded-DNA-specific exonuclease RecJ [Mergibacter septicus]WMR96034.1 single-stranded-DNA-specific exonuclease RecJ [Mergibacter septicus]